MLFDTPDSILKSQSLNDTQKKEIRLKLLDSKYSKLEYNKTEIQSQPVKLVSIKSRYIVFYSA